MNMKPPPASIKPQWPVLIHYANDPEMDLVMNEEGWLKRKDIGQINFQPDDKIIDITGQVFKLAAGQNSLDSLIYTKGHMKLEDLLGLIKAHMSEAGACCVAKLYAPGYREAFEILIESQKDEA